MRTVSAKQRFVRGLSVPEGDSEPLSSARRKPTNDHGARAVPRSSARHESEMFRSNRRDENRIDPSVLPQWEDTVTQRMLDRVTASDHPTIATLGAAGMAALEEKATEIHRSATEGLDAARLLADVDATTWDAAETLAWLNAGDATPTMHLPHRDADAMMPVRGTEHASGYWCLDDGGVVRKARYSSVWLRTEIAEGRSPEGAA